MRPTLLDIAKGKGVDGVIGLIDEVTKAHPEIRQGEARQIKGMDFNTLVRVGLFDGSTFRSANEGVTVGKGRYENRRVQTYIAELRFEADKAVADTWEDGWQAYLALNATDMTEKAMVDLAAQFYYGPNTTYGGNAKAFPGLIDAYDATNRVVDAGGTTAATGSSVWMVKWGPRDVQWVYGNGGELGVSDARVETIYDGNTPPKPLKGYVQDMLFRPGLQVASQRSIVRIKKLTADVGKGLTDSLLTQALLKFETGTEPDVIFMTRRSLGQLQASRTASNDDGRPAPMPTSIAGLGLNDAGQPKTIPFAVTDAISDTESLTL